MIVALNDQVTTENWRRATLQAVATLPYEPPMYIEIENADKINLTVYDPQPYDDELTLSIETWKTSPTELGIEDYDPDDPDESFIGKGPGIALIPHDADPGLFLWICLLGANDLTLEQLIEHLQDCISDEFACRRDAIGFQIRHHGCQCWRLPCCC